MDIFSAYFLVLTLLCASVILFVDKKYFDRENNKKTAGSAKLWGIGYIVVSLTLYIINIII